MSSHNIQQPSKRERKSSFFKLIESFALEIGTLKKEMGKKPEPIEVHKTDSMHGLSEAVGGLFLQASPCSDTATGVRDSGYDSLHRRLSVLDRLIDTHCVWLQLDLSHQDAVHILQDRAPGTFVVRKSSSLQKKVLSLRMDKHSPLPVKDFVVKESQYTFSLEGSGLSFADLFRLVAFCCISRDVLPFTLKLPEAIASAKTSAELAQIAKLGAGFWDSGWCQKRKGSSSSSIFFGATAPDRGPPPGQRALSVAAAGPSRPRLETRTPSELECCQSNGALCFINPLFIKVHHPESEHSPQLNSSGPSRNPSPEKSGDGDRPASCDSDFSDNQQSNENKPFSLGSDTQVQAEKKQSAEDTTSRSPPSRPPPPQWAPPVRQRSMPEKIAWINVPKEKAEDKERSSSLLSRLGSSLSISPSSSPPKRLSITSPISIPRPSFPISFASLSSSPRRAKSSPSSSLEDAQCHLALEEQTIEKALLKAKRSQQSSGKACTQPRSSLADTMTVSQQVVVRGSAGEQAGEEGQNGVSQRLSDVSLSTDSSDSLDFFSQSSSFFLPPLHDPSPPTVADFNTHLPLSLPSSHLLYCSTEDDDDDDDEEEEQREDEEEPDYGVGLESDQDQDQDLTMMPPGHRTRRRRPSASAIVLQKALRGHLRKMSGVFSSLLTPEKRAIRRVVELSKDKASYFGSLVQDYLSYMGEGAGTPTWQSFASGLELLQTLRQFITQMKSYLRQSSELGLPIESLIPEDQIDHVLEKAMHKCVLKPLKAMISAALQEFQVRSGEWQELRDNMSLAKARQPQEMGVEDTVPPDPIAIEKIKCKFHTMCKLYSPEKKVTMLLRVCKLIYTIMEDNSGRLYGADDFLPMLTYVLAQCDMPQLDNEILYMMELLDPSLLHGEGGYYLTSAYGAMSLIRNFQEEQAARVLSSKTRNTLHQWHQRRTTLHSAPSFDDFQNYLRVALQELDSGCTAKTLPVCPYATVEEVCQLCAIKFKVSDPASYGLFLLMEGSSQQLAADTHPQRIKAELNSRPQAPPFHFVYRRLADRSASGPPDSSPGPDNLTLTNLSNLPPEPATPSPDLDLRLSR